MVAVVDSTLVFIPYSNRQVFTGGTNTMTMEVYRWLQEQVGRYTWQLALSGMKRAGATFHFDEAEKALLFKLTWAGL